MRVTANFEDGVLVFRIPCKIVPVYESTVDDLTSKEMAVFELLRKGTYSNKEIGDRLNVSVHAIKIHVSNVLRKLECQTRAEVAYKFGKMVFSAGKEEM
jgi:DNA-binding NarL/FixJ family response regulator